MLLTWTRVSLSPQFLGLSLWLCWPPSCVLLDLGSLQSIVTGVPNYVFLLLLKHGHSFQHSVHRPSPCKAAWPWPAPQFPSLVLTPRFQHHTRHARTRPVAPVLFHLGCSLPSLNSACSIKNNSGLDKKPSQIIPLTIYTTQYYSPMSSTWHLTRLPSGWSSIDYSLAFVFSPY